MDFWRAVGILNNRKWLILFSVIVATALTWFATRLVGAKWVATVRFMAIQSSSLVSSSGKGSDDDKEKGSIRDQDRAQLAAIQAVLKSKEVVDGALKDMKMAQFPPDILDRVTVTIAGPRIYAMEFVDNSPSRAENIANALADSFIRIYKERRMKINREVVDMLNTQITNTDKKITSLRQKYDDYRLQHNITGNVTTNLDQIFTRIKDASNRRDEATQLLARTQAQITSREKQLPQLSKTVTSPGRVIPSTVIGQLKSEIAVIDKQYNELKARYSDDYPTVKKAKAELDRLNTRLNDEIKHPVRLPSETVPNPAYAEAERQIAQLRTEAAGIAAQIPAMESAITEGKALLAKFKGVDSRAIGMAKEVDQQNEIRAGLVARLNLAQMALDQSGAQQPVEIADRVNEFNPAQSTTKGRTTKLMILAIFGSLIAVCAIVVALDSVDRRVKTVVQAEMMLPARVVAAIPQPMGPVTYSNLARATEMQPGSLHSEAYRFLGLHLLSPRGPKVKSLMVLSAKAEQGSTTTVTNLGITLAQAGKKVIIIDANVRTAELHQVFEMPNDYGFTNVLKDPTSVNLDKALRPTSVPNLKVMTSGPMSPNAWELFRSSNLQELSRMMSERADFILYDTPSALIFTDALNLAPVVDAAFLCVRALEQLTGAEQRVVELLEQNNVTVLGSVLSDVPAQVVEGYHNYQHYYAGGAAATAGAISGRTAPAATSSPMIEISGPDQDGKNG